MVSKSKKLVNTFRLISAIVYLLDITVSILFFMANPEYLNMLVGFICVLVSVVMLFVSLAWPNFLMARLDQPRFAFLFTFRGRYFMDLIVSLFLYAMLLPGAIMATVTLGLIFGIRFVGVRHPEAFSRLFRQSDDDDDATLYTQDDATYDEGTYDGTLESGR